MSIGADSSSPSLRHPARFHAGVLATLFAYSFIGGKY
jgi:hypothetical protein